MEDLGVARGHIAFPVFGFCGCPGNGGKHRYLHSSTDAQRQALETQLQQLETQISGYETTIANYQKQGNSLTTEIDTLNANIAKIQLQIKAINISLTELNGEIQVTNSQISYDREQYRYQQGKSSHMRCRACTRMGTKSSAEILLAHPQISDFFDNVNNLDLLQQNVQVAITNLASMEETLQNQKQELG